MRVRIRYYCLKKPKVWTDENWRFLRFLICGTNLMGIDGYKLAAGRVYIRELLDDKQERLLGVEVWYDVTEKLLNKYHKVLFTDYSNYCAQLPPDRMVSEHFSFEDAGKWTEDDMKEMFTSKK